MRAAAIATLGLGRGGVGWRQGVRRSAQGRTRPHRGGGGTGLRPGAHLPVQYPGVADADESSLKRIRAALAPLGITPGNNQSRRSSDVEPLAAAGAPAVTLDMDGMDYFDLHHTANDTVEKILPERINQSAAAYAVFLYLAAELDRNLPGTRAHAPQVIV